MQSLAVIERIAEPADRAQALSRLIQALDAKAAKWRIIRDQAARSLYFDHDLRPIEIYRDILHVSRQLFVRMTADRTEGDTGVFAGQTVTEVKRAAGNAASKVREYTARAEAAREARRRVIDELLAGKGERRPMSNAEVARLTGLTTARVAQVRYGTR